MGEVPLPMNISCEHTAGNSTANSTYNSAAKLFLQVNPQETEPIRRKIHRKVTSWLVQISFIFY